MSARSRRKPKNKKQVPAQQAVVSQKKAVKFSPPPGSDRRRLFVFKYFDADFPAAARGRTWETVDLLTKLRAFEDMPDDQLGSQGSHRVSVSDTPTEVRKRLKILELDDHDYLKSFRLTGAGRLISLQSADYGADYEIVIWFDPDHEVYPSTKKNT